MSLRYGLLGLLSYQDMTGYELKKTFDGSLHFMWSVKASQIYRELQKMESESIVKSSIVEQPKRFDRKVYSVTESGKVAFAAWIAKFPQGLLAPIRDEFIIRVFFGKYVGLENLEFEIKRYKKQEEEELATLDIIEDSAKKAADRDGFGKDLFYWLLTVSRARKSIIAEIEWATEALNLIKIKLASVSSQED